ncbi:MULTISPECIES: GLPGLI family protein [unclassified Chryseobacterium]|uniref:GLPGLI family protein n=1 Tax=unclassified Chryseobacterium TaxID=2593645 RepID=UPI002269AF45|nr:MULTISPECIES: GLPGLI family protein [unclassified Chryseobacterium]
MIKFLFFTLFLCFNSIHSQNLKNENMKIFTYRLTYFSDSTNTESSKQEDFDLQILGNKSCFVSTNYKFGYQNIRMMAASGQGLAVAAGNLMKLPKSVFRYSIYKENNDIAFYEKVYSFGLKYYEKASFDWKLSKEKKKIDTYNCNKATLTYGGREWIAWYTTEIPISEGPYKFKGLPGMIIQLYDVKNQYNFSLIEVQTNKYYPIFYDESFNNYKEISRKEYFATRDNLKNNYVNNVESQGITFQAKDKADIQRNINKKGNNPIELK